MNEPGATVAVRVWDVPTRLFHWSLAALVTASLVTGKFDSVLGATTLEWHRRFGYAILGLVAFRLVWGFAGGTHARFDSFLKGPAAVLAYARAMRGREHPVSVGHNPLGGWSVVAMIVAVAAQAVTGLFLVQEDYGFTGPLARFVSNAASGRLGAFHEANFWVIAGLVGLHLAAIATHAVAFGENLVAAMFSGTKRLPGAFASHAGRAGGLAGLAVAMAAAAAVVFALVRLG